MPLKITDVQEVNSIEVNEEVNLDGLDCEESISLPDGLSFSVTPSIVKAISVDSGTSYHDQLKNLDYEHSGHTGFASEAALNAHSEDTNNPHEVTKEQVGLDQVDNTSDLDKPISTATQEALDELEENINPITDYEEELPELDDSNKNKIGRIDGETLWYPEYKEAEAEELNIYSHFETNNTQLTGRDAVIAAFTMPETYKFICNEWANLYSTRYTIGNEVYMPIRIGTNKNNGYIDFDLDIPLGTLKETDKCYIVCTNYFSYNSTQEAFNTSETTINVTDLNLFDEDVVLNFTASNERPEETLIDITNIVNQHQSNQYKISYVSGANRFFFNGFKIVGEDGSIKEWKKLATVDYVDEQIDNVEEEISTINTTLSEHAETLGEHSEELEGLTGRVSTIETEMGTVQIFDADELPIASKPYLNKILRVDGKLYQCVNLGDKDAFIKNYSFENVNGTSEIFDYNWADVARVVTDDFKNYFTAVDYETVDLRDGGALEQGCKYKINIDLETNINQMLLNGGDYNTIFTIVDYKEGTGDIEYTLPISQINYFETYFNILYNITTTVLDSELATENRQAAIDLLKTYIVIKGAAADNYIDTALSGEEAYLSKATGRKKNMHDISDDFLPLGYNVQIEDVEIVKASLEDDPGDTYGFEDDSDLYFKFIADSVGEYSHEVVLTKINYDWSSNKIFRNNGEIKFGNSTTEGKLSIYRTDDSPLPITRIQAKVKSWNTNKPSALSLDIGNGAYSREEVLIEPSEDIRTLDFTDFGTDTGKGVKIDLDSCLYEYEHADNPIYFDCLTADLYSWYQRPKQKGEWRFVRNDTFVHIPQYDNVVPGQAYILLSTYYTHRNELDALTYVFCYNGSSILSYYDTKGVKQEKKQYADSISIKEPMQIPDVNEKVTTSDGLQWGINYSSTNKDFYLWRWIEGGSDDGNDLDISTFLIPLDDFTTGYVISTLYYEDTSTHETWSQGYGKSITEIPYVKETISKWTDPRLRLLELDVYYGNIDYQWVEFSGKGGSNIVYVEELPEEGDPDTVYVLSDPDQRGTLDLIVKDTLPKVGNENSIYVVPGASPISGGSNKQLLLQKYYKKITIEVPSGEYERCTNLTNSHWRLNDTINFGLRGQYDHLIDAAIDFESSNRVFREMIIHCDASDLVKVFYDGTEVYERNWTDERWDDPDYKEIVINGGEDVESTDLIDWLYENGTLLNPEDVCEEIMDEEIDYEFPTLRIKFLNFDGTETGDKIYLYRITTRTGKGSNKSWIHPENFDSTKSNIQKLGYGNYYNTWAGKYPDLPAPESINWMTHKGYVETEWTITEADLQQGYLEIPLKQWLLNCMRPYTQKDCWDQDWQPCGKNGHLTKYKFGYVQNDVLQFMSSDAIKIGPASNYETHYRPNTPDKDNPDFNDLEPCNVDIKFY